MNELSHSLTLSEAIERNEVYRFYIISGLAGVSLKVVT